MKITKQQLKDIIKEELETALNEKRTPDYYAEAQDWRSIKDAEAKGWRAIDDSPDEPVLDDEGNLIPIADPDWKPSTISGGEQDGLFPGHLVGAHGDVYQKPAGEYVTSLAQKDRTNPVTGKSKDDHYGTDLGGFGKVSSAGTRVPDTIRTPIRKQKGLVTHSGYSPSSAGYNKNIEFVKPFGGAGVSSTGEPIPGRAFNLDDYEDGTPMTTVRSMHHADGGDLEVGDYVPVDGKIADAGTSGTSTAKHGHIELGSPGDIDDAIAQGKNISDYMPTKSQWLGGDKESRFQTSDQARANLQTPDWEKMAAIKDQAAAADIGYGSVWDPDSNKYVSKPPPAPAVASATPSKPTTPAPTVASATTPRDDDDDTGLDDTGLDEGIPKPGQNLAEAWGFNMDLSKLNE